MHHPPFPSRLVRMLAALFLALAAASSGGAARPASASGLAAVLYAQQPAARVIDAQQAATVEQAFDLLMDEFVHPLGSAALLQAAWSQLEQEAAQHNAPSPDLAPVLTEDRDADLAQFRAATLAYLNQVPNRPADFVPAHALVRGMVAFVNEGHTSFLNPKEYQDYLEWSRGELKYGGIGAHVQGPGLLIGEVFSNTPAARAGLRAGDAILGINGAATAALALAEAVRLLRGPEGTTVELLIGRRGLPTPIVVTMRREQIAPDAVASRLIGDDLGYIRLRSFPEQSVADAVERAMATFEDQGVRGLILDLRGNSGGRLDVGVRLLSHFLPPGTRVYETVDRGARQQTRVAVSRSAPVFPLAVLVDNGTASMGEIFAAAVQEQGVATVVGSTTEGNVAGGKMFPLADGSALQVTVLEIQSSAGKRLNGVGVVPDETVNVDLATALPGDDVVLERAIAVLNGDVPGRTAAGTYTVLEGDTLKAIAERFYGQREAWPRLYVANRDAVGGDPDALTVGTRLSIPP